MAFSDFVTEDFKLFWPDPVRAHPNVPLNFRFSYYEKDNRFLTWSMSGNPAWMSIDQYGRVTGTPATPATHTGIQVTVAREGGGSISRTFTCTVGTSEFIFVATTGSDASGTGAIGAPYQTLNKALTMLANGVGKTIYLRGGTYQEFWTNSSPTYGKYFSTSSPTEVRSYPGETALIDCLRAGHGPWAYGTSYFIFSNFQVTRADYYERAGIIIKESDNCVIKDCVAYDCVWDYSTNPAGIYVSEANNLVDRCVAYDNGDPNSPNGNSTNIIVYTEGGVSTDFIWVLNCKTWGSLYGVKIKHAGPKHLVVHNFESADKRCAAPMSNYSSIRYAVGYGCGLKFQEAEPSRSGGPVLVEHCTIVNAGTRNGEEAAVDIYDPYLVNDGGVYNFNIFYDDRGSAGTGEFDKRLFQWWIYQATSTTDARPKALDYNLWYSPSQNNIIRSGSSAGKDKSYAAWQALGYDAHSRFGNPNFANRAGGDLSVATASNSDFGAGLFAGAFVPGRIYTAVGQHNNTLLVWDGVAGSLGGGTEPPVFATENYLNAATRYIRRIK